jgi:hypothetical protein
MWLSGMQKHSEQTAGKGGGVASLLTKQVGRSAARHTRYPDKCIISVRAVPSKPNEPVRKNGTQYISLLVVIGGVGYSKGCDWACGSKPWTRGNLRATNRMRSLIA